MAAVGSPYRHAGKGGEGVQTLCSALLLVAVLGVNAGITLGVLALFMPLRAALIGTGAFLVFTSLVGEALAPLLALDGSAPLLDLPPHFNRALRDAQTLLHHKGKLTARYIVLEHPSLRVVALGRRTLFVSSACYHVSPQELCTLMAYALAQQRVYRNICLLFAMAGNPLVMAAALLGAIGYLLMRGLLLLVWGCCTSVAYLALRGGELLTISPYHRYFRSPVRKLASRKTAHALHERLSMPLTMVGNLLFLLCAPLLRAQDVLCARALLSAGQGRAMERLLAREDAAPAIMLGSQSMRATYRAPIPTRLRVLFGAQLRQPPPHTTRRIVIRQRH